METYAEDLRDQSVDDFAADSLELHPETAGVGFWTSSVGGLFRPSHD